MNTKTILATCYAVNPYKGSEDAMGWNFVYQIARYNKVIAITRENNRDAIERFMAENPDAIYQNITFLYFDLPKRKRFWKKGSRGAMLYFYLWQKNVVQFIQKKQLNFDIVHNVNFHNDWTPSFLWKLKKPFVWGPVGHHSYIPKQFLQNYSVNYYLKDRLTWIIKKLFWNHSSDLKKSVENADHIWCMNTSVPSVLQPKAESFSTYPSIASEDYYQDEVKPKPQFNLISIGRFVPLKGFDLTIFSFIKFILALPENERSKCKLTLVGSGNQKEFYQKLIKKYQIEAYTEIIDWIDRKDLMNLYRESSVFLFPSHEGAGMVVAEALSFGLPVICLDNEGPGEFITEKCGFAVERADFNSTVNNLYNAINTLYKDQNLRLQMSIEARNHYLNRFTWEKRGDFLNKIYENLVL